MSESPLSPDHCDVAQFLHKLAALHHDQKVQVRMFFFLIIVN